MLFWTILIFCLTFAESYKCHTFNTKEAIHECLQSTEEVVYNHRPLVFFCPSNVTSTKFRISDKKSPDEYTVLVDGCLMEESHMGLCDEKCINLRQLSIKLSLQVQRGFQHCEILTATTVLKRGEEEKMRRWTQRNGLSDHGRPIVHNFRPKVKASDSLLYEFPEQPWLEKVSPKKVSLKKVSLMQKLKRAMFPSKGTIAEKQLLLS